MLFKEAVKFAGINGKIRLKTWDKNKFILIKNFRDLLFMPSRQCGNPNFLLKSYNIEIDNKQCYVLYDGLKSPIIINLNIDKSILSEDWEVIK